MTNPAPGAGYRERLAPGPWLFITLLLLIPAAMLVVLPIAAGWALPVAILLYAIIAGSLLLLAPAVEVAEGALTAGRARIPVAQLGTAEILDADALRAAIGPGLDARAYLMVRGYIHSGLRIEVTDPADPAPYWIVTTRKPQTLSAAIEAAR